MKSKFKNIIFDWTGVIKDALEDHVLVINKMLKKFGVKEITPKEMMENWESPYMKFWAKYFPSMTPEEEKKVYIEVITGKNCPSPKPYVGIVKLIKNLKNKGIKMAVLSSDWPETIYPEIKKFALENIFDEVAIGVHNKSKEIKALIKRNKFKREETVFVGDTNHEIEAGKYAGVKTIAVTWGLCAENKLKLLNPDYLVHNVKELEEILLK